jgi:hypothetical protein
MHNRQQSAGGAETDHSVSWLFISTRVLKNKQRVVEDSHRLFEGDAVLTLVLRSLRFILFNRRTTVFEELVHRKSDPPSEVIIAPNSPGTGVLVAMIEVNGAPVELMQIDHLVRKDL